MMRSRVDPEEIAACIECLTPAASGLARASLEAAPMLYHHLTQFRA